MESKHHKIVVVGAGLAGSLVAKEFSDEFAKSGDTVMLIDAFPETKPEDIGNEFSSQRAGPGIWQRHVTVTSCPEMAAESRDYYLKLGQESGLPVYTPRNQVTMGSTIKSSFQGGKLRQAQGFQLREANLLDNLKEKARKLGLAYSADSARNLSLPVADDEVDAQKILNPDLISASTVYNVNGFVESSGSAGVIHINSALEACKQHIKAQNTANECVFNHEITRENTRYNEAKGYWEIDLGDRLITAEHVVFTPGSKGIMDLMEDKDVYPFIKPEAAKKFFSPQRAPAFIYRFPDGHEMPDCTFLNRKNEIESDVIYAHPDGKHVYFARFSDPANPYDQIEQRLGSDEVTDLDRSIVLQRIKTLHPQFAEMIENGEAELVTETVYRYTTTTSGMPVSQVFPETNPAKGSVLLACQGGWAKNMPAIAKEHVRQVLGKELEHPKIMGQCTLANCEAAYKRMQKAGGSTRISGTGKQPVRARKGSHDTLAETIKELQEIPDFDMYRFEHVLSKLLSIENQEGKRIANDQMLTRFYEIINKNGMLREFVGNCHINIDAAHYETSWLTGHIEPIWKELLHYVHYADCKSGSEVKGTIDFMREKLGVVRETLKGHFIQALSSDEASDTKIQNCVSEIQYRVSAFRLHQSELQHTKPYYYPNNRQVKTTLADWDRMPHKDQNDIMNSCVAQIVMETLSQALAEKMQGELQEKPRKREY